MDLNDDALDEILDGADEASGSDLPPLDPPGGPDRRPRNDRVDRRLPVWAIVGGMALVIAVERLSMLVFVTDAGPALLAVGGTVFFVGNALAWWFGSRWLARKMAEARPPRDASGRIVRGS